MKHYTVCFECSDLNPTNYTYSIGEVGADLIALCTCPFGHYTVVRITHNLCDVLYSSAVHAFVKDCLSESVMSFAAALERAYEMFIKVTLYIEGLSYKQIDDFWKELSSHSERQYGAFCTQYLKILKEPWKINPKMIEFRNKVVHKGYIASTEEVTKYAEYITQSLYKILKYLHENHQKESDQYYFHETEKTKPKVKELRIKFNARLGGSSIISLLNWNVMDMPEVTFSNAIKIMSKIQRI